MGNIWIINYGKYNIYLLCCMWLRERERDETKINNNKIHVNQSLGLKLDW